MSRPRFRRVAETERASVRFIVDGSAVSALAGDSLLTAILTMRGDLRQSEFGPERRAGFCLMAACQDCWVWTADGGRLRACDTPVSEGMSVLTSPPDRSWTIPA